MSTVINTNIAAIRTHNTYNRNNDYMNAAMTKVATGMKINSAKDGASTWAISEKMRERIRANDQANQNVQNDTAMLKTAEGGISNTIDILKTLKERAINAANDSNINSDRTVIQQEIDQLVEQITENANKVKFNGRTLLNGNVTESNTPASTLTVAGGTAPTAVAPTSSTQEASNSVFKIATADIRKNSSGDAVDTSTALTALQLNNGGSYSSLGLQAGDKITFTWTEEGSTNTKKASLEVGSSTVNALSGNLTGDSGLYLTGLLAADADITTNGSTKVTYDNSGSSADLKADAAGIYVVGTGTAKITSLSVEISNTDTDANTITYRDTAQGAFKPTAFAAAPAASESQSNATLSYSGEINFHIGGEADYTMAMKFGVLTAAGLGIDSIDVSTQAGAVSAIDAIDSALNLALKEQTRIGAYENRLGYTSDNLVTMNENLEAADSVMRDSDIAKEMTNYMKYAVLSQASQYMLAQAGQNAFSVLNLLQA